MAGCPCAAAASVAMLSTPIHRAKNDFFITASGCFRVRFVLLVGVSETTPPALLRQGFELALVKMLSRLRQAPARQARCGSVLGQRRKSSCVVLTVWISAARPDRPGAGIPRTATHRCCLSGG